MRRKRQTPEEIIKKLREAATLLAEGQSVEEVCKKLEVSPPTYHRRRQRNCGNGPVILQTELWPSTLAARRPANFRRLTTSGAATLDGMLNLALVNGCGEVES